MHGAEAGRGEAGMMLPLLLRGAHLTPEQDAKVREILTARRSASRALVAQLRQAQDELADKLFAPGPLKEADLQPQLQRIAQLRQQLLQESTRVALDVRALLTQEQLSRTAQVKDRMRQLESEMRQLLESGRP
jgi:Spy/CpxP family protein refolding chaperone